MKKKITVIHTHRYTLEKKVLYDDYAECNLDIEGIEISYDEADDIKVIMHCFDQHMEIHRIGEIKSHLYLEKDVSTNNLIESAFGNFEIAIKTDTYYKEPSYIVVEYDIETDNEDQDGFKIEVKIKEGVYEFN